MTVSYCSAAGKRKLCLNMLPPHTGSGLAETERMLLILLSPRDLLSWFALFLKKYCTDLLLWKKYRR